MNQTLQLHATQHVMMTPQLQQALRLLQLSALEFEQEIEAALAQNPFLDPEAGGDMEAPAATVAPDTVPATGGDRDGGDQAVAPEDLDGSGPSGLRRRTDFDDDDSEPWAYTPAPVTLHDHLLEQVRASALADRDKLLAGVVVEALDDDGYLRQSFSEIARQAPETAEVAPDDLALGLRFVQSLEPAGVGARSPQECLELQLERLEPDLPGRGLALTIVREHLEALAAHDTPRLVRALGCDEDALREANGLILLLDPHPGRAFGSDDAQFVVADVVVRKQRGRWVAAINPDVLPRIRVNEMYADVLRRNRTRANGALAQQLQEARWLVRIVQQRFQTIQRVAQEIVDRQQRFFEYGDVGMKPLFRRDVARTLDLHESTVSRVTSGKYMATPRGLIEFGHFFGSHVVSDGGRACSATAIRALIRYIIAREDAAQPLSDIKVTRKLKERGVRVARRTVTKYRDGMRIPPVEARRMSAS